MWPVGQVQRRVNSRRQVARAACLLCREGDQTMIKGWTDTVRFPRLGEIRLGEKDENGYPKALDYFVVPPEVQEVYGPEPRELDIMFPHEDLEVVMPAALKRYGEQWGLICRGDGEIATLSSLYARKNPQEYQLRFEQGRFIGPDGEALPVLPGEDGRGWVQIRCPYRNCPHYQRQHCREVVLLNVLLPKVPGVLGVYTLATGSFHSYTNIRNALGMLRAMVGRISFIPLRLRVRMQEVHPEVGDKRIKRHVPVMYIDMTGMNLETMIELAREERLALIARSPIRETVELEPVKEDEAPELLYPHLAQGTKGLPAGKVDEPVATPVATDTAGAKPVRDSSIEGRSPAPTTEPVSDSHEVHGAAGKAAVRQGGKGAPNPNIRSGTRGGNRSRGGASAGSANTAGQGTATTATPSGGETAIPAQPSPETERGDEATTATAYPRGATLGQPELDNIEKIRRLAAQLPEDSLAGVLELVHGPFGVNTATPDQIIEEWQNGDSQMRELLERALAVHWLLHAAKGLESLLLAEFQARGFEVDLSPGADPVGLQVYESSLTLDDLRAIGRSVQAARRGNGNTGATTQSATVAAEAAAPAARQATPSQAGAAPVVVVLQATTGPRLEQHSGRQFVLVQALVRQAAGGIKPRRVVTVVAEGPAGDVLARVQPGQVFQALVHQVTGEAVFVREVGHAAVAV